MQCSVVHSKAGITLQPHTGEVPKLQRKSSCVQPQVIEDDQSGQSSEAEQNKEGQQNKHPGMQL